MARGLMLALISLANVSWFFWGQPAGGTSAHPPPTGALDSSLQFLMIVAVDGRSYPLFAMLFGYGMVQFTRSRLARGLTRHTVRRMLQRRHWALLLVGALHAALLFMGDVLGAYALAGLLLVWLFFDRRDRTLVVWVSIVSGLLVLSTVSSMAGGLFLAGAPTDVLAQVEQNATSSPMGMRDLAQGDSDYLLSAVSRLSMWAGQTVLQLLGLVIPLSILIGWLAARHRLLDEPGRHRTLLRRCAIGGIVLGWLGGVPNALLQLDVIGFPESLSWTFLGLSTTTGLAGGLGYAAVFGLLAARSEQRPAQRPVLTRALAALGQRSLTFYLFQSVVFAPLLAAWGFGLGQRLTTSTGLLLAFAVWLVSLPLAGLLASRGLRGPAEAVLRRLTYGHLDPHPPSVRSG